MCMLKNRIVGKWIALTLVLCGPGLFFLLQPLGASAQIVPQTASALYMPVAHLDAWGDDEHVAGEISGQEWGLLWDDFVVDVRAQSGFAELLGEDAPRFFELGDSTAIELAALLDETAAAWFDVAVNGAVDSGQAAQPRLPNVVTTPVQTEFARDGIQVIGEGTGYVTEDGRRVGLETEATLRKNGTQMTQGQGWFYNFARCPAVEGTVPGEAWQTQSLQARVTNGGVIEESAVSLRTEATVVGYTKRSGKLESYDLDVTATLLIRNARYDAATGNRIAYDPRSYRSRMTLARVPINAGPQDMAGAQIGVWGPRGRIRTVDYLLNREPMQMLTRAMVAMQSGIESEWARAEKHWFDDEGCLQIVFDPASLALQPGGSRMLDVGLALQDGSPAGEADLQLSMEHGGSVAPQTGIARGEQPLAIRVTAPGRAWTSPAPTLVVAATGLQGKASARLSMALEEETIYIRLNGGRDRLYSLVKSDAGDDLSSLSARVVFDDPKAVSIKIEHTYLSSGGFAPGAQVVARVRLEGHQEWQDYTWTDEPVVNFCRDFEDERVAEILLDVTSAAGGAAVPTPLPVGEVNLTATNIGCAYWEGWVESEWITSPDSELVSTYAAYVMFERMPGQFASRDDLLYKLIVGEVTWSLHGVFYDCVGEGGPYQYKDEGQWSGDIQLNNFGTGPARYREYTGDAGLHVQSRYTIHCPGASMEDDWIHGAFWTTDDDKIWRVSEDGTQLKGDYTKTLAGKMRQTVRWELNSFPE